MSVTEGPAFPGGNVGPSVASEAATAASEVVEGAVEAAVEAVELAVVEPARRFAIDAVSRLDLFFCSCMFGIVARAAGVYAVVGAFWLVVTLCRGL